MFIATSQDGFIARENGEIDWLPGAGDQAEGEDYGFREFFSSVDALVMGRRTFELVLTFGRWPYGEKPVIVLSHHRVEIPEILPGGVEVLSLPPHEVLERLERRGVQHVYVDGGKTIQEFLNEGLIDDLTITRVPVLLGSGLSLFGPLAGDIRLRHEWTRAYPNGLVQSRYTVETGNNQSLQASSK